jgi:hypothetical protein
VYTNIDFKMISTTVMVERPGYDQIAPGTSDIMVMSSRGPANLITANHIISIAVCDALPLLPWQTLTHSEKMLLLDNLYSPVTVDKTTVFGVRPPELHFVKEQGLYYKWFLRDSCTRRRDAALALQTDAIQLSSKETHWVDGFNSVIRVQLKALPFLIAYANGDNGHP